MNNIVCQNYVVVKSWGLGDIYHGWKMPIHCFIEMETLRPIIYIWKLKKSTHPHTPLVVQCLAYGIGCMCLTPLSTVF